MKKYIYIVGPIWNLIGSDKKRVEEHIKKLEKNGHNVKCLKNDTDYREQGEDIVLRDRIDFWWEKNKGSYWLLSQIRMAKYFVERKELVFLNVNKKGVESEKLFNPEQEKSIIKNRIIEIRWNPQNKDWLIKFAQTCIADLFEEKEIIVTNLNEMEITPENSFSNILLAKHFKLQPGWTIKDLIKAKKGRE